MAGEISAVLLCSEPDRSVADADAATLQALGLGCVVLAASGQYSGTGRRAVIPAGTRVEELVQAVAVVYLSEELTVDRLGRLSQDLPEYLNQSRPDQRPLIAVVLDQTGDPGSAGRRTFTRVLDRARLSQRQFTSELSAALLEELDRTGVNLPLAQEGDETRLLPGCLIVTHVGQEHVIPTDFRGLVTVGRSATCQICVASTFASRLHGCFRHDGQHWLYRDMSRNGTVLYDGHEEEVIQDAEKRLPAGAAEIRIGDVSLRLTRGGA